MRAGVRWTTIGNMMRALHFGSVWNQLPPSQVTGQWQLALLVFNLMSKTQAKRDALVFNVAMYVSWRSAGALEVRCEVLHLQ